MILGHGREPCAFFIRAVFLVSNCDNIHRLMSSPIDNALRRVTALQDSWEKFAESIHKGDIDTAYLIENRHGFQAASDFVKKIVEHGMEARVRNEAKGLEEARRIIEEERQKQLDQEYQ